MLSRPQQGQTNATAEVAGASPPVPKDYGPTISFVGLFISLAALFVSWRTSSASSRRDKLARFEADHGTALRLAIREMQSKVDDIRALSFASAKTIAELRGEAGTILGDLDAKGYAVVRLISEIVQSTENDCVGWNDEMLREFDDCLSHLERLTSTTLVDIPEFRKKATAAKDRYDRALSGARMRLETVRKRIG